MTSFYCWRAKANRVKLWGADSGRVALQEFFCSGHHRLARASKTWVRRSLSSALLTVMVFCLWRKPKEAWISIPSPPALCWAWQDGSMWESVVAAVFVPGVRAVLPCGHGKVLEVVQPALIPLAMFKPVLSVLGCGWPWDPFPPLLGGRGSSMQSFWIICPSGSYPAASCAGWMVLCWGSLKISKQDRKKDNLTHTKKSKNSFLFLASYVEKSLYLPQLSYLLHQFEISQQHWSWIAGTLRGKHFITCWVTHQMKAIPLVQCRLG